MFVKGIGEDILKTARDAGLINYWQFCTDFNPSASTFNKLAIE